MRDLFPYPECNGRMNCLYAVYSHIALENYLSARKELEVILGFDSGNPDFGIINIHEESLYEKVITCIVFSNMSCESFLNDYLATCLGDQFYYENFDHLKLIQKLELVSGFLFKKQLDKSTELYDALKTTVSERNKLVHNKSTNAEKYSYTEDELNEAEENFDPDREMIELYNSICSECKSEIRKSYRAIRAVGLLADYFSKNDLDTHAEIRLLPNRSTFGREYSEEMLKLAEELQVCREPR